MIIEYFAGSRAMEVNSSFVAFISFVTHDRLNEITEYLRRRQGAAGKNEERVEENERELL